MSKMTDEQTPGAPEAETQRRPSEAGGGRLTAEQRMERRRRRAAAQAREDQGGDNVVVPLRIDETERRDTATAPDRNADQPVVQEVLDADLQEPFVTSDGENAAVGLQDPLPEADIPVGPLRRGPGQRDDASQTGRRGRLPQQPAAPVTVTTLPVASKARLKKRHWGLILSFFLLVVMPSIGTATYLWMFAVNQYSSTVAFSVRKEDSSSTLDMLGGLSAFTSSSSSSDTDVLYAFIKSQELVEKINARLHLSDIFSRPVQQDPFFAFTPGGTIEDLVDYWKRMITVYYDPSTGLIEVRALAFDPDDAQHISQAIYAESTAMINDLSAIARADATRYAKADLDEALDRLKGAREAVTEFRNRNQMVDPTSDVQGQMGLLTQLQGQQAQAMIDYDMLRDTVKANDPRVVQAKRRIDVIQERISAERLKFGPGGTGTDDAGTDFAAVVAEYERLNVDLNFAEAAYTNALSAYEGAKAEAQRQSRYLAAHVQPTKAESSRFPQRWFLFLMVSSFLTLGWSIMALVYYSLRDRH